MMYDDIGIGLLTCNRPDFFQKSLESIPCGVAKIIVVNDGVPLSPSIMGQVKRKKADRFIQNEWNLGVAKSKNILFRELLARGCRHIFIMEDDIVIKKDSVFMEYIKARNRTGVQHFNYGYHGPANKEGISGGWPAPRYIISCQDVRIAINKNSVGAFCYYSSEVLDNVGLIDERFHNACDHVDHDYRIALAGYSTPYWNFADLADSMNYLSEIECCNSSSTIRSHASWQKNINESYALFNKKHGYFPAGENSVPDSSFNQVMVSLDEILRKYQN